MVIVPCLYGSGNRTRLMACSNKFIASNAAASRAPVPQMADAYPENSIFILGAGRFGRRAFEILTSRPGPPIWLIDKDQAALSRATTKRPASHVLNDASRFLVDHFPRLRPGHTIVPAVPYHLAFEWLYRYRRGAIMRESIPREIEALLPHTWIGAEGSLLISYADFLCPEDCPEPARRCTVTGKRRGPPLYERISKIVLPGWRIHTIRSRQLAPGVGGYKVEELSTLINDLQRNPEGKWLIGTACRCHGTITALHVREGIQEPRE